MSTDRLRAIPPLCLPGLGTGINAAVILILVLFLFLAGVDILNLDTHVCSIINRNSLTDLQRISRLK